MKPLVNPLLWFLLLQLGGLIALRRLCRAEVSRAWKLIWLLLLLSLLGVSTLSTPSVSHSLERSLSFTVNDYEASAPAYIFVLGGGYMPGTSPDQDVLGEESSRRVLTAIAWWREYPQAKLVFSGASREIKNRSNGRLAQLMAETAIWRGVPESHLILESSSMNTREHPIEALKLTGVTPETYIGLVTSNWHMRRAQREFCRYFSTVLIHPIPPSGYSAGWQDFIPNSGALESSVNFLREWVGLIWYAVLENMRIR